MISVEIKIFWCIRASSVCADDVCFLGQSLPRTDGSIVAGGCNFPGGTLDKPEPFQLEACVWKSAMSRIDRFRLGDDISDETRNIDVCAIGAKDGRRCFDEEVV